MRAGDTRVVLALGLQRDALARLRSDPRVALCVLGPNLAFTAYAEATVLRERLETVQVAAVELRVDELQDHLADGRTEMLDGARWRWRDPDAADADARAVAELSRLAATG
jgi:hypothetical protein